MVDLARRRLAESNLDADSRVDFVVSPGEALDVPASSVDLVISTFVLQLVPDRIEALREALRVLRPGGMAAYLTWLDRDARQPFLPAEEFDEAVYDLEIDEPEGTDEPHAGDVALVGLPRTSCARPVSSRPRRARSCSSTTGHMDSYLEYKLDYDERSLLESLNDEQRAELNRNARSRLARLQTTISAGMRRSFSRGRRSRASLGKSRGHDGSGR